MNVKLILFGNSGILKGKTQMAVSSLPSAQFSKHKVL